MPRRSEMNVAGNIRFRVVIALLFGVALGGARSEGRAGGTIPVSSALPTQRPLESHNEVAIERAHVLFAALRERSQIPGFAVAVAINGEVIWQEEFGYADLENLVSVTPLTRFRIGSVSKPLTAAAMVRLLEQGHLHLDEPVQTYVASFPAKAYPITLRQLAGHLGGIRHYREGESVSYERVESIVESLKRFQEDPLLHRPGTAYSYSSYGYNLLGAAVESACGKSFALCLEELVFQPLRMRDTVADFPDRIIPHRTRFYARSEAGLVNAPYSDRSYKLPAGGYLSTAADLVRFGSGLLAGDFLRPETLAMLFTSQRTAEGSETGYGMGWRPDTDWEGRPVVHHGGSAEGGRAFLLLYPGGLAISLLANLSQAPIFKEEAWTLASLFLDGSGSGSEHRSLDMLSGVYHVTGQMGEETVSGTLHFVSSHSPSKGWLILDDSTEIEIVLALHRGEEIRIIGAGYRGMMNLWATFDGDGFEGHWNWLGKSGRIRGVLNPSSKREPIE